MTRDPRYDILFEPVRIGPHVARNRFYQVPHCNGMGHRDASALAAMRGMKAEGGWAVVCTEMVEIHHTADVSPYVELRLWSDHDIPMLARIADNLRGRIKPHRLAVQQRAGEYPRMMPFDPGAGIDQKGKAGGVAFGKAI